MIQQDDKRLRGVDMSGPTQEICRVEFHCSCGAELAIKPAPNTKLCCGKCGRKYEVTAASIGKSAHYSLR